MDFLHVIPVRIIVRCRHSNNTTDTPHRVDVNSTLILRRYIKDQTSKNFRRISVISVLEKSALFPKTFFDIISLVEKLSLFPRTFFGVILLVEKYTLFSCTFFDVIWMVEKFTLFPHTFFDVIL